MEHGTLRFTALASLLVSLVSLNAFAQRSQLTMSQPAAQVLHLGTTTLIPVTITAGEDFVGGNVNLAVDRAALDLVDPQHEADITITPAAVALTRGTTMPATITIRMDPHAPALAAQSFDLVGHAANSGAEVSTHVMLSNTNVYEIRLSGTTTATMVWSSPKTPVNLRSRAEGQVIVRFINVDPVGTNIIHGNRAIPHMDISRPLAPNGGTYEATIKTTAGPTATGSYYSHTLESGAAARVINFNRP